VLPPNDPSTGYRSELPPVRGPREPVGYQRSFEWGARFQGLLLLLLGLAGIMGVYLVFRLGGVPGLPAPPPPPPPPPGLGGLSVPSLINVASCLGLLITFGSLGLILVGLRRMFDPY